MATARNHQPHLASSLHLHHRELQLAGGASRHAPPQAEIPLGLDGVTEAANALDEEFGNERVISSARAARSLGAQGIRTRILEEVTRFCNGNFHDDASLMVLTVN